MATLNAVSKPEKMIYLSVCAQRPFIEALLVLVKNSGYTIGTRYSRNLAEALTFREAANKIIEESFERESMKRKS